MILLFFPSSPSVASYTTYISPLTVKPTGYGELTLSWTDSSVTWNELKLIRSSYGYPTTIYEGTTVLDVGFSGAPNTFTDVGPLKQGAFYYYTLFVYVTGDAVWIPAGYGVGLVTKNFGSSDLLWGFIPQHQQVSDGEYSNQLKRFLSLFGYQFDVLRTEINSLRTVGDIENLSGVLLPAVADELGMPFEPEMGLAQNRVLLKNAVHLYETKGTKAGVEGLASALTGYDATVSRGPNLMVSSDDSSFESTIGTWVAIASCAVARSNTVGGAVDSYALRITGSASADATAEFGTTNRPGTLVPATAGLAYTASMYVRTAATARATSLRFNWFDVSGALLSSSTYGSTVNDATNWAGRPSVTATAPANTAFCSVTLKVAAVVNTEVHYADALQIEQGSSASTYDSPRKVIVTLGALRRNLIPNPSFETDITLWDSGTTTNSRSTAEHFVGSASFEAVSTGAGGIDITAGDPDGVPVVEGETYTFSLYVKTATAGRTARASMYWYDATYYYSGVNQVHGDTVALTPGVWTRLFVTGIAHHFLTAVWSFPSVTIFGPTGAGENYFVDAALMEKTEDLGPYFDGNSTPSTDFFWAGTTNLSQSFWYPRKDARLNRLSAVLPDYLPAGVGFSLLYAQPGA